MEQNQVKLLKRDYNKAGITILGQQLALNVIAIMFLMVCTIKYCIVNSNLDMVELEDYLNNILYGGTYMIIAVLGAFFPVFILRGKKFFTYDIRTKKRTTTLKVIIIASIVALAFNFLSGLLTEFLEFLLNKIGYTSLEAMDYFENNDNVSMHIYAIIVAPIMEEAFYRGAILRQLESHGSKFAIIASAVMFGCMHGNFVQIPNAIIAGLILGYLAKEYSLKAAIFVHMINNAFAQGFTMLSKVMSENILGAIYLAIVISFIIITFVLAYKKRENIRVWLINNRIEKGKIKYFFTCITIIITLVLNSIACILSIEKL